VQLALTRVENTLNDGSGARPFRHRGAHDNEASTSYDNVGTTHKMEFPKFDGKGDQRVAYTVFNLLDDAQLWSHRLELNYGHPT
jgi:hypothetical protein